MSILKKRVSQSAILNFIDGAGSSQGQLLILTSKNPPEKLDNALTQPGRVDLKLQLGLTSHAMNAQLFAKVFSLSPHENNVEVNGWATQFADRVPEYEFSPAEIQAFLIENRESPAMALQKLPDWIDITREEKSGILQQAQGAKKTENMPHSRSYLVTSGIEDICARKKAPSVYPSRDSQRLTVLTILV